jgi:hypothetical protein
MVPSRSRFAGFRALATGALLCAVSVGIASCGGTTSVKTGSPGTRVNSDVDTPPDGAASLCDAFYSAQYTRCGGPTLPADEAARERSRFDESCSAQMALPGGGMTAAALSACVTALEATACQQPSGLPVQCLFHGTLAGGAACADGIQCLSGTCRGTMSYTTLGPAGPYTCGTCTPVTTLGSVCNDSGCPGGSVCMTKDNTAKQPVYTCNPIVQGDVGAPCDDDDTNCKPGLYCALHTEQCTKLGTMGAACGEGPNWYGGCQAPLSCVGTTPGSDTTCQSGSTGAFCIHDTDCAAGLGCAPGPCSQMTARIGCAASGTCQAVTWGAPGDPCDGYRARCRVGTCNFGSFLPVPPADGGPLAGTCPGIIADGEPCDRDDPSTTCDAFSECFEGKCALVDDFDCK